MDSFVNLYGLNRFGKGVDVKKAQKDFFDVFNSCLKIHPLRSISKDSIDSLYESVLFELKEKTMRVEKSFASKLLHSIYPNQIPIIDNNVLQKLRIPRYYGSVENAKKTLIKLSEWYEKYIKTSDAIECIKFFDKVFPDFKKISSYKKIDFFLWQSVKLNKV